jgi:DNA modification methylase
MGNCRGTEDFFEHYRYLVKEQLRVMRPGRNVSIHCMLMPTSKERHGFIGLQDFRGDIIRLYQSEGFIFHSEVVIWKDPVTAMQRTKALGLLHKQLKKDAAMSRQGIPDYLVTMRKPGINTNPITNTNQTFPVSEWQEYASPVWMDIDYGNTLQGYRNGRDDNDEKHICPLQLDTIERLILLYSNKGDTVLTPFMGIGSEVFQAVKMNRNAIGFELKESYYDLAKSNVASAVKLKEQVTLF